LPAFLALIPEFSWGAGGGEVSSVVHPYSGQADVVDELV
jgi:hypothetical protein